MGEWETEQEWAGDIQPNSPGAALSSCSLPIPCSQTEAQRRDRKTSAQRSKSSKEITLSFRQTSNFPGRWAPCLSSEHPSSAAFHPQLQGATKEATSLVFMIFRGTGTLTLHRGGLTCYAIAKATRFTSQVYHEAQVLALCEVLPLSAAAVGAHEQPINKTLNSSFAEAHLFC